MSARAVLVPLVLVLVAGLAAVGWWHAADRGRSLDERAAVEEVARGFAVALLSYDHRELDEAPERLASLVTPRFASTYVTALEDGLHGAIAEVDASSVGTVREVFVSDVDAGTARAIVVADAEVAATTGTRTLEGAYLELDLAQVDGRWRVDGLTSLAVLDERFTPEGDGTS